MQEILDFDTKLKSERKVSTFLVGAFTVMGLGLTVPLWNDSIKWTETLFCFQHNSEEPCEAQNIRRGISWIVEQERRNFIFDSRITFLRVMPPEDGSATGYGALGTAALLTAYGISKSLTDRQEKAIHSQLSLLKVKALENDLLVEKHLDVTEFSKSKQADITKAALARETTEVLEAMKPPGEQALDEINGRLQGELALKQHELTLSEIEKHITDNKLAAAEATKKLEKISSSAIDSKGTTQATSDEKLKTSLIDALKSHEGSWLWKVITAAKPLWIIGEQGTGKTNTSVAIGLIRKYCLGIPVFRIADRHLNGANSKVWALLAAQNKADNDSGIIEVLQDTYERRLERISLDLDEKQAEQFLLDEFTHLKDIDEETVKRFIKSTFSDTRKAKERFIGVTHLGTNEAFGDGTSAMRKAGSFLMEKFTADGEKPLSRVVIKHGLVDTQGNKLEDVEYTLPSWFEAFRIHQHFNGKPIDFE
ncbi:ATP-binding protein [Nostoc sp. TCL26-01]|uniref:ATP-binding protein n=1 Tax=Nostoc sp. TCL26-01 TaxID=2576904 RepID=UPI0015BE2366|nr:ATP-binding protein [Nostoc sp. TCL26-01]QLE60030.1 ATP-binding protein [Nostoc sp. TCL26-01]